VWPDVPKEWVNIDRWPNTVAKDIAYEIFAKIDSYKHPPSAADLNRDIPAVRFSLEAQEVFDAWREKLEQRLRSGDLVPAIESHLSKNRKTMPSIALIFQVCRDLDLNREIEQVEREAAEMAVRWCDYLESHSRRLYSSAENPQFASARALLKKIKQGVVADGFTIRDIYQNDWSKLTSSKEVKDATEVLIDFGWLRCEEISTNGRTKIIFKIHPELRRDKES
jgi:putative DNA primase/helicase